MAASTRKWIVVVGRILHVLLPPSPAHGTAERTPALQTHVRHVQDIDDGEEEKALAKAYEFLLGEVRSDTPITSELIQYVHGVMFDDLYEWASRWRTVTISKPKVTWPPPDYLDDAMKNFEKDILRKYPASALETDQKFCAALGHIQGEFLAIHPFREGNARTIKLVTDILAVQSGRFGLVYDPTDKGRNLYINAARAAMLKDYNPMALIIKKALNTSRKSF